MEIVFTVASYYPSKGGVQTVTKYLAEGLVNRGHNVTVITSRRGRIKCEKEYNGVRLIYCEVYTLHGIHKGNRKRYLSLVKKICNNADVLVNVCLQTATTDFLLGNLCDIKCKKILYLHGIHNFKWQKNNLVSLNSLVKKIWYNLRWKFFYKTAFSKIKNYSNIVHLYQFDNSMEYMRNHGITQNTIIGNAAEDQFFKTEVKDSGTNSKDYYLCVANYEEHKNQEFSLRAFYKTENTKNKMIYIGREETTYLEKLIQLNEELRNEYGYKDVVFLVNIERGRTIEYIQNCRALILSSKIERYPVIIVEAMASGVPYISTDQGCVRFLPGGLVIRNIDEMSYWMDFIHANNSFTERMGEIGLNYAKENLTISSKISQFEQVLMKLR